MVTLRLKNTARKSNELGAQSDDPNRMIQPGQEFEVIDPNLAQRHVDMGYADFVGNADNTEKPAATTSAEAQKTPIDGVDPATRPNTPEGQATSGLRAAESPTDAQSPSKTDTSSRSQPNTTRSGAASASSSKTASKSR